MNQPSRGLTALVCEDDAAIREMIRTVLERDGFAVEAICDGDTAVVRIRDGGFDLVVLDLMIPGMSGFDVLEHFQSTEPSRLKRVLITTAVPMSMVSRVPTGVCHILPKPFDIDKLLALARECAEDTLTRKSRRLLPLPSPG
jgi:DNA-binding response OmpR family regulator